MMPWGTVGDSRKKVEGFFPQVRFIPRIVLGRDFIPLVTNICIQFMRHVYYARCQDMAIEPHLVKE